MNNPALVETSMSSFGTFQRCRKRYRYSEVLGWAPRSVATVMEIGTVYHGALAEGIKTLEKNPVTGFYESTRFLTAAVKYVYDVKSDRNNMPIYLDQGQREGIEDMIGYSYENFWKAEFLRWDAILAVEEPAYMQIGRYVIRNTFDCVVKYRDDDEEFHGRAVVLDAKTVDDPRSSKEWIPLDFQTRSYPLAARGKWGQILPFKHVFIARDVAPGFGHRSLDTETGKKRSKDVLARMQDVNNYVQVEVTDFQGFELDHFERKLVNMVMEVEHAEATQNYPETPVKMGPFSCGGCPYFESCKMEMDGKGEAFQPMLYILKGSPEWNALQVKALVEAPATAPMPQADSTWMQARADALAGAPHPAMSEGGYDFDKLRAVMCEHAQNAASLPHASAEDAAASFAYAVGAGLIDDQGNLLCNCATVRA